MVRVFSLVVCAAAGCAFNDSGISGTADAPAFTDAPAPDAAPLDSGFAFSSCALLHNAMPALPSDVYMLALNGEQTPVYCDMEHFGGGWTLAQRTVWDFSESQTLITSYASFYDSTIGTPGAGAYRLAGRLWPTLNMSGEHMLVHYPRATDDSRCAALFYRASGNWDVPIGGGATISGIVQNVIIFDSGAFSTTDNGPAQMCVNNYSAVPWTYASCCRTCPTFGQVYFTPARPAATYLATPDEFGHTVTDQCGTKTPVFSGNTLYGDDAMEYYLR